jgi:hypothetical protein
MFIASFEVFQVSVESIWNLMQPNRYQRRAHRLPNKHRNAPRLVPDYFVPAAGRFTSMQIG